MFEDYKKLVGADANQEKQESLISKCFNFFIGPYRKLVGSSDKQPQEIIPKKEVRKKLDKPAEAINEVKPPVVKGKVRSGNVVWRKK